MITDSLGATQPPHGADRYDAAAITFHWLTFVLVVTVGILGLLHDSWPEQTQAFWINFHAVLGLFLWLLILVRLVWRLLHKRPKTHQPSTAANVVHWALYALLLVIPLVGIVTFVYHGRVFDLGVIQIDPGIKKDRAIFHPTEDLHGYLAYALFTLAGLHAAAALWHHFYLRDGVLRRMWR